MENPNSEQDILKEFKGKGTKDDPIIIEHPEDFIYYNYYIESSERYLEVINCDFRDVDEIFFEFYQNITVKNFF